MFSSQEETTQEVMSHARESPLGAIISSSKEPPIGAISSSPEDTLLGGVQSSTPDCLSSSENEDSVPPSSIIPSLMPSIISTFTPPLVASSAEEQCVDRSRTTTLYTVDSHGQISFSISESVSESDQLSNKNFSKLIGKRFIDDEDGRM